MTSRRTLGTGPQSSQIRAPQADLLDLPGVRLPDLGELRAGGVLGARPVSVPALRRTLGDGSRGVDQP